MRFMHLSDLHIGKKINNLSLNEDQDYILKIILKIIDDYQVESVLIAGDIYDKAIPSTEAIRLFDDFLVSLVKRNLNVFIISGNHDSPERLSFGRRLMNLNKIYISPVYNGTVDPILLEDRFGDINVYLLPFIKPVLVKHYYPEETIDDYTKAVEKAINEMHIDYSKRNIIVSHQFVTGSSKDGSEELSIGGLDNVDSYVYENFDYVALGHVHRPQNVKGQYIRYSGTPMKYSFSEEKHNKTITIIDINEKGNVELQYIPIQAKRDFITVSGKYEELINHVPDYVKEEDFIHIILTDEMDIPNAFNNLTTKYKNLVSMSYDNKRTRGTNSIDSKRINTELLPIELFSEFFENRNNQPLTLEQTEYLKSKIDEIWEENQ